MTHSVVEQLYGAFSMYTLNHEILDNWQLELEPDLASAIEKDVVLALEQFDPRAVDPAPFTALLDEILAMDMDNHDLQALVMDLFVYLIGFLYQLRIALYKAGFMKTALIAVTRANNHMVDPVTRLVAVFMELGCEMDDMRKVVGEIWEYERKDEGGKDKNDQCDDKSDLNKNTKHDKDIDQSTNTDKSKSTNHNKDVIDHNKDAIDHNKDAIDHNKDAIDHIKDTIDHTKDIDHTKYTNHIKESTDTNHSENDVVNTINANDISPVRYIGSERKDRENDDKSTYDDQKIHNDQTNDQKTNDQSIQTNHHPKQNGLEAPLNLSASHSLRLLNTLNYSLRESPPHSQFALFDRPASFPFSGPLKRSFTIHAWFKINMYSRDLSVFELAGNDEAVSLKVKLDEYSKFVVEGPRGMIHSFSPRTFDPSVYTHFVMGYDGSQLLLYLDGEHCELIGCSSMAKYVPKWTKLYVHHNEPMSVLASEEILVKNLCVLSKNLSHQWVCLLHRLGTAYVWDCKEFSTENVRTLMNELSPEGQVNMITMFGTDYEQMSRLNSEKTGGINYEKMRGIIYERMTGMNFQKMAGNMGAVMDMSSYLDEDGAVRSPFHAFASPYHTLYAIGGASMLLVLVDHSLQVRPELAVGLVRLLLVALANDWRMRSEFENVHGYATLGLLLAKWKENAKREERDGGESGLGICIRQGNLEMGPEKSDIHGIDEVQDVLSIIFNEIIAFCVDDELANARICNTVAFRQLVLDFGLWHGTRAFCTMMEDIVELVRGRHRLHNVAELSKMRFLRRMMQFLKEADDSGDSKGLLNLDCLNLGLDFGNLVETTVASVLQAEGLVEAIRLVLLHVVYAVSRGSRTGFAVLRALTGVLCDTNSMKTLKKFSRSISVHWILLLLGSEQREAVVCAVRLLDRLLRALGPHVIRRFFEVSHGVDILTHYLGRWWADDEIVGLVLKCACSRHKHKRRERSERSDHNAGISNSSPNNDNTRNNNLSDSNPSDSYSGDSSSTLSELVGPRTTVCMPDFLVVLNNMVLLLLVELSKRGGRHMGSPRKTPRADVALDVLHLVSMYMRLCGERGAQLGMFDGRMLDGVFEVMGQIKVAAELENELATQEGESANEGEHVKFEDHMNPDASPDVLDAGEFSGSPRKNRNRGVNELSKRFSPENENSDLSILIRKLYFEFVEMMVGLFIQNFTLPHFDSVFSSMTPFSRTLALEAVVPAVFEHINGFVSSSHFIFNERAFVQASASLVRTYLVQFVHKGYRVTTRAMAAVVTTMVLLLEVDESVATILAPELGPLLVMSDGLIARGSMREVAEFLLYHQVPILRCVAPEQLAMVVETVVRRFSSLGTEDQEACVAAVFNFVRSCVLAQALQGQSGAVAKWCCELTTRSDDDAMRRLQRIPIRSAPADVSEKESMFDIVRVTLHNGGTLGVMDQLAHTAAFAQDCTALRAQIVAGETQKAARAAQDRGENTQFLMESLQMLRVEAARIMGHEPRAYSLDSIEGVDRIRARLVVEDQIPQYERLDYEVEIPRKSNFESPGPMGNGSRGEKKFSRNVLGSPVMKDPVFDTGDLLEASSPEELDSPQKTLGDLCDNRRVLRQLYVGDRIVALWNVSQINGLVPVELLMILGTNYVYLIDNYFHCSDGNVVDVNRVEPELRDPIMQLVNSQGRRGLTPRRGKALPSKKPPGDHTVGLPISRNYGHHTKSWSLARVSSVLRRQFLLRDIAVEVFFSDGASVLLTCRDGKVRDQIYRRLATYAKEGTDGLSDGNSGNSGSFSLTSRLVLVFANTSPLASYTQQWRRGQISNFYYLMVVNTMAGRTFNDLTQYPVFPWVLADYTSTTLDLNDPKTFRDLSKPMGAQTEARAEQFRERYDALASLADENAPAFHYGTHYSLAMIVTSFLIRVQPYVQSYLLLQGGKFDHADRLFLLVARAWKSASADNTTDVRELTPEFFYLPEMMTNANAFEFGRAQLGAVVDDVELPPWAHGDPTLFVQKHREALELPYVSANLHQWIDLVFGYKQSGPELVRALNVFHHLSYGGAINVDSIRDETEKRAVIGAINNFGQTPVRLFLKPHPKREVNGSGLIQSKGIAEGLKGTSETSSATISKGIPGTSGVSSDGVFVRKRRRGLVVNQTIFLDVHASDVTCIEIIGPQSFLSASADGVVNAWKYDGGLQLEGVLRGHFAAITHLVSNRSWKVGVSGDAEGRVLVWDLARFKYVRELGKERRKKEERREKEERRKKEERREKGERKDENKGNDSEVGNENEVNENKAGNENNDAINKKEVDDGCYSELTALAIAPSGHIGTIYSRGDGDELRIYTLNGDLVIAQRLPGRATAFTFGCNELPHAYWNTETFAVGYGREVEVYELVARSQWEVRHIGGIQFDSESVTMTLRNISEVDLDEKLMRRSFEVVVGDASGVVYTGMLE